MYIPKRAKRTFGENEGVFSRYHFVNTQLLIEFASTRLLIHAITVVIRSTRKTGKLSLPKSIHTGRSVRLYRHVTTSVGYVICSYLSYYDS